MVKPRFCRQCGTSLSPGERFCPSCGLALQTTDGQLTSHTTGDQAIVGQTGRLPQGKILHSRYRLLEVLGQGGMGAVYIAQDTQLGDRLVAVKEMSMSRLAPQEVPLAVERFQKEAHLLADLHHANLPAIYDHFEQDGRWYLVMSFIQGETLQAYLDRIPDKRLSPNEVVQIGIELCKALDYLHTHEPQIIFRDLKPLNIMITPKREIYLIDFGIARHFKQEQTKDTASYYSVGYAPPEQYGLGQTWPRSDIYSLGVVLHQMLTGHDPVFSPFKFPTLLHSPSVPEPLAKLVMQMLEMEAQHRPASAEAVRRELENIQMFFQIGHTQAAPVSQTMPVFYPAYPQSASNIAPPPPPPRVNPYMQPQPYYTGNIPAPIPAPVSRWKGFLEFFAPLRIILWSALLIGAGLFNFMTWGWPMTSSDLSAGYGYWPGLLKIDALVASGLIIFLCTGFLFIKKNRGLEVFYGFLLYCCGLLLLLQNVLGFSQNVGNDQNYMHGLYQALALNADPYRLFYVGLTLGVVIISLMVLGNGYKQGARAFWGCVFILGGIYLWTLQSSYFPDEGNVILLDRLGSIAHLLAGAGFLVAVIIESVRRKA